MGVLLERYFQNPRVCSWARHTSLPRAQQELRGSLHLAEEEVRVDLPGTGRGCDL